MVLSLQIIHDFTGAEGVGSEVPSEINKHFIPGVHVRENFDTNFRLSLTSKIDQL
jgi:hypothetical protein